MLIPQIPALNCTSGPVDFDRFSFLSVSPVRDGSRPDEDGTYIEICSPDDAEMISIYGIGHDGEAECLHDADDAAEAVRLLKLISETEGIPVQWYDEINGNMPKVPTTNFVTLAEWLTGAIHDDLDDDRDDAFDNHPLTPAREMAVLLSDYAGLNTALHSFVARAV